MSFIQKPREENSPYLQLLMLVGYALLGVIVFTIIAMIIIMAMYGMKAVTDPYVLSGAEPKYLPALQTMLIATSLGLFLCPAILLPLTEGKTPGKFYSFKKPDLKILGLVLVVMLVSMPFMEWVMLTNQKLVLPDFLKGLEHWIRRKEDETMQITLLLLKMAGTKELVVNLFMIALVPAVSEELMFRGGIQRTLGRVFKNPHVAIWLSAAVFSAIHVQFYGFLPRMLLGAGFGYVYLWSGSLWYSMLGHFINNAYAVCVAFYMQKHNMDISKMDSVPQFAWYGYLISFVLTILVFQILKKQTTNLS
ncbi:MAG TPA: CPBP family intramembrane glutamic endopeptidase [Pedobacter sp.]|uniref:CPBP family intramembrane glutamic endopeptidase n=1 Tax=Pedobacter sp. TaxID=1411316 RepID=UPI002C5AE25B|nr:CPBP family intramembrane glutamic endopeptidase [Pedobacter sp.]HMI05278.1 CPBP family intramembrane glutamic endopeptidase [Pedobacter sp.]